jgi:ABC-type tungstate transport system permease subunit
MPERRTLIAVAIVFSFAQLSIASAQQKFITVASTTSTEDSGLFRFILPPFIIPIEGDKLLFNQYGVILVNPARHPV